MHNKGGILYSLVENRESSLITLRTCSGWIHCTLQFVRIFFHRCCSAELLSSLRNFPWGHEKRYHLTAPKIKFNPLKDLSSKITNYITKIPFQVLLKIKKRILLKHKFNYQYILREIKILLQLMFPTNQQLNSIYQKKKKMNIFNNNFP